jgi:hypothetical protein
VTDLDTSLVEQVLNIAHPQLDAGAEHHCQADDLGARLEVPEWERLVIPEG